MLGSSVLEIGIGIVFTYLSLSLVVTAANELLASCVRSRARDLERGIRNLLDGTSVLPERWWRVVFRWISGSRAPQPGKWSTDFFKHQLINGLSKDGQRPSYIPSSTFAAVLMHLIQQERPKDAAPTADESLAVPPWGLGTFDDLREAVRRITAEDLRNALLTLLEEARADLSAGVTALKKFNQQVETWYDHAMDRVSGWYKRRTQWFLFFIGLGFTALLNVDTIAICRRLGEDDVLRASMIEAAKAAKLPDMPFQAGSKAKSGLVTVHDQAEHLRGLGIPLGWMDDDIAKYFTGADGFWKWLLIFATKLTGLLLTAFAASLGAPFWFDVLNRFMSVRGVGKAPEEQPKTPKQVLQPQSP